MERVEAEAILDGDRETAVALLMRIGELVEANRRLEARVAELERRLSRSSRNSSLPPSQDPPSAPPRPRRPGSGRKRGGQPGHEGSNRPLLPLELAIGSVDAIVERAGEALAGPYTRLEQEIKSAPVINIDETGWKTAGASRTLWGVLTAQSAVFRIAPG